MTLVAALKAGASNKSEVAVYQTCAILVALYWALVSFPIVFSLFASFPLLVINFANLITFAAVLAALANFNQAETAFRVACKATPPTPAVKTQTAIVMRISVTIGQTFSAFSSLKFQNPTPTISLRISALVPLAPPQRSVNEAIRL
jgi:hypothetical protein